MDGCDPTYAIYHRRNLFVAGTLALYPIPIIQSAGRREYGESVGVLNSKNASREKRSETTIWQRRFWEHTIRDEKDMEHHLNYIHYNPVKHGHVDAVRNWEWSSFHRYVRMGYYDIEWGIDGNNIAIRCGE